jgi:hypothetical protein
MSGDYLSAEFSARIHRMSNVKIAGVRELLNELTAFARSTLIENSGWNMLHVHINQAEKNQLENR